jgi:integrase
VSMYKGPDGYYFAELRSKELGRWKSSMRTKKKAEAEPRYHALKRLWREAHGPAGVERRALLDQVRAGAVPVERIESMVLASEPLVAASDANEESDVAPWPTVEAAIERYLDWITANPKRRVSTWKTARAQLRRFAAFEVEIGAVPTRVGTLPLDAVRSEMVELYQHRMIAANTPPNSVTAYMTRVSALWAWVQRRENRSAVEGRRLSVILHSPIDPETAARETSRRDRCLDYDEGGLLLSATPEQLLVAVALGLFAGLRIGEVLTLRPSDIDLDVGTLAIVQKQTGVDGQGRPVVWKPKTRRAERVVPIAPPLRPILEVHLAVYASSDWLLPASANPAEPMPYSTFRLQFETIVQNAELVTGRKDPRGVIFHTLRHTFASWLVMRQVDLFTVAQLLGDTLKMVEDTYAHLAPDFKRRAIAALEGAVRMPRQAIPETATDNATDRGKSA